MSFQSGLQKQNSYILPSFMCVHATILPPFYIRSSLLHYLKNMQELAGLKISAEASHMHQLRSSREFQ